MPKTLNPETPKPLNPKPYLKGSPSQTQSGALIVGSFLK